MQPVRTHQTAKFTLQGLDCASCAAKIEVAVQREMGLSDAAINFAARTIFLPPQYAPKVQEIIDRIEPGVVLVAAEEDDGAGEDDDASDGLSGDHDAEEAPHKTRVTEIAVAASLMVLGLVFHTALQRTPYAAGEYAVFLSAYWLVGRHVVAAAFRNFRHGNFFDENALMTVATVGAFLIGELPEAVGVMLFYSIGEELQDRAVDRSRRSIKNLLDVRPETHGCSATERNIPWPRRTCGWGNGFWFGPGRRSPSTARWPRAPRSSTRRLLRVNRCPAVSSPAIRCSQAA